MSGVDTLRADTDAPDPDHPANEGWFTCDEFDDEEQWLDDDEDDDPAADVEGEYDPDEPQYQQLDELGAEEDDIEGEEWKYGLAPGERACFQTKGDFKRVMGKKTGGPIVRVPEGPGWLTRARARPAARMRRPQ